MIYILIAKSTDTMAVRSFVHIKLLALQENVDVNNILLAVDIDHSSILMKLSPIEQAHQGPFPREIQQFFNSRFCLCCRMMRK